MKSVAIIDDDAAVLASLEALFVSADYEVHAFASAADFLTARARISPACIITDLRMPDMDGLALLNHLQAGTGRPSPVIVISGHGDTSQADAVRAAGAADYLVKPFAPQQLLTRVRTLLANA